MPSMVDDTKMKLYHYSKDSYKDLRTLEMQKKLTEKEKDELRKFRNKLSPAGEYWEHISFFFDRIPLESIGQMYGPEHKAWAPGTRLKEYVIDTVKLHKFSYAIVEPPDKTAMLFDDNVDTEEYYRRMLLNIEKYGYHGNSNRELEKASKPFVGKTAQYFKEASKHPKFDSFKDKYAACVPHVMIYPAGGIIKYDSVVDVKVSEIPAFAKWVKS